MSPGKSVLFLFAKKRLNFLKVRVGQGTCPRVPQIIIDKKALVFLEGLVYNERVKKKTAESGICRKRMYAGFACRDGFPGKDLL